MFENTFVSHDQESLSCQIPITLHVIGIHD